MKFLRVILRNGYIRATIEMKLPIEASDDDGILTKNGTMIYGKEDDAVTIGVQPLKDELVMFLLRE